MDDELYKKYRPKTLAEMVGQDAAVRTLKAMTEGKGGRGVPHAILFTGPSGTGKTTAARILKSHLKVADPDFREVNAADSRGIDFVREVRQTMGLASMRSGGGRCWLIDEAHQLTKDAQNALLKMLEDTPKHVWFMLASTDPGKLLKTIQTRCTEVRMVALPQKPIRSLLQRVCRAEKLKITEELEDRIVEVSDGSARKALVVLGQVADITDPQERLEAVQASDSRAQGIEIARLLVKPRCSWPEVAAVLKTVEDEAETLRRIVLGYSRSVLLGGGPLAARAFLVIEAFRDNFFDGGHAALAAACYEVINNK